MQHEQAVELRRAPAADGKRDLILWLLAALLLGMVGIVGGARPGAAAPTGPFTISTVAGPASYEGYAPLTVPLAGVELYGIDSTGALYMQVGTSRDNVKIGGGTIASVAGSAFGPDGLTIAYGPNGDRYLVNGARILRQPAAGGAAVPVAGNGTEGHSGDGGPATSASIRTPDAQRIAFAPDGSFYFAESNATANYIRHVALDGTITTVAGAPLVFGPTYGYSGDGGPATAAQIAPSALGVDGLGRVVFVNFDGATSTSRIRRIAGGTITTIAGNGVQGHAGDGGPATAAGFAFVPRIAAAADGTIYLLDGQSRVRQITPGGTITTIAGNGTAGDSGDGGPATAATFLAPDLRLAPNGTIYLLTSVNSSGTFATRVRAFTPGGTINAYAGNGSHVQFDDGRFLEVDTGNGGSPASALAFANGTLYAILSNADASSLGLAGQLDGAGHLTQVPGVPGADAAATRPESTVDLFQQAGTSPRVNARYNVTGSGVTTDDPGVPVGVIAYAADGTAYYSKAMPPGDCRVYVRPAGGAESVLAGSDCGSSPGSLLRVQVLAVDAAKNVYVADSWRNQVVRVTPTGTIAPFAGTGSYLDPSGDGGPATAAVLPAPMGLAVDSAGNVFISSRTVIRRVATDGTIGTVAGQVGGTSNTGDGGPASAASLAWPGPLALAPNGDLYVATIRALRKITGIGDMTSAPPPPTPPGYAGVTPSRLFDTRDGSGGVPVGKSGAGAVLEVPVAGRFGVPSLGVGAVSLNVTVTEPDGPGFVTVYPCGERPLASNVNYVAGQTVPNAVIAPVSPSGTVCLYTLASTHVLADVSGWFAAGSSFSGVSPSRLFDTRDGSGGVPVGKLGAGAVLEVPVAGRFGVPSLGVGAVSLNVTVTEPDGPGFVTVYPCGERPLASNVNYVAGQTVPNAVIAPVSPSGTVCLYTLEATHLLADVSGWLAAG